MSVMIQSHEFSPLAAKSSSPDANPRARYPSEQSDSTSAVLNGSSSSITAIRGSLDTHHPGYGCGRRQPREQLLHLTGRQKTIHECYMSCPMFKVPWA